MKFKSESLTMLDHLSNHLGDWGVEVMYELERDDMGEGVDPSIDTTSQFHEIFVKLDALPKAKCPRESRVRMFVGEAEEHEARIDAENCVWKSYGCGHMRRRLEAEDAKSVNNKDIFSNVPMQGLWLDNAQCEVRGDEEEPKRMLKDMGLVQNGGSTQLS